MAQMSITISQVSPVDTKRATATVAKYREAGLGSNRSNWDRITQMLACVLTVLRGGEAEITAITDRDGNPFPWGKLPYHTAHRAMSEAILRKHWNDIYVVGLRDCVQVGNVVTGETTTTNAERVFFIPASRK
jgi:hypothetical protein